MFSETRVCIVCKKTFEAHHPNQLMCSEQCKWVRLRTRQRGYWAEGKPYTKKQHSKPEAEKKIHTLCESIFIVAWKAKKAGLSYGQYVATH